MKNNINELMDLFYTELGNKGLNYANKTERKACEWLLSRYGIDELGRLIDYIKENSDDKYFPVITTPYELKTKFAKLGFYIKKQQKEQRERDKYKDNTIL